MEGDGAQQEDNQAAPATDNNGNDRDDESNPWMHQMRAAALSSGRFVRALVTSLVPELPRVPLD